MNGPITFKFCMISIFKICIIFWFLCYLPSPNAGLAPQETYNANARGTDNCRGSNRLCTRTLDRYTRAGLPECVVSTISGSPPKITQVRTHAKDTCLVPGNKL